MHYRGDVAPLLVPPQHPRFRCDRSPVKPSQLEFRCAREVDAVSGSGLLGDLRSAVVVIGWDISDAQSYLLCQPPVREALVGADAAVAGFMQAARS
jgi:hypothetical protein